MHSLSVIITAYNEAHNVRAAYESVKRALAKAGIIDYEIILITSNRPDGTNDGTPAIADRIAAEDIVHIIRIHGPYAGLGYKFRRGVKAARKDFVTWIPGDDETVEESIANMFSHLGKAPIIITYTGNRKVRSWKRRCVSWGFVKLCNILFGLHLKYFNGISIFPRSLLQATPMTCDNFAYMAEIIIYLVKSGVHYIEVPQLIKPTSSSSSFKLKSVLECLGTLASLFWKIHFRRQRVTI